MDPINLSDVGSLLCDGKLDTLKSLLEKDENVKFIDEQGMELLSLLIGTGFEILTDSSQLESLSEILFVVVNIMSPKESLLSILEQIEIHGGDKIKLQYLMKTLKLSIEKDTPAKRLNSLKWTLRTVNSSLTETIELPPAIKSNAIESEKTLEQLENTELKSKVYDVFDQLTMFYNYFITSEQVLTSKNKSSHLTINNLLQIQEQHDDNDESNYVQVQKVYTQQLIHLLGYPLFDIPYQFVQKNETPSKNSNEGEAPNTLKKTRALAHAQSIMRMLGKSGANVKLFLDLLETIETKKYFQEWLKPTAEESQPNQQQQQQHEDAVLTTPNNDFKIQLNVLGNYFYLIHVENIETQQQHNILCSPTYIFHQSLYVINYILCKGYKNSYQPYVKSLMLTQRLLDQLCPRVQFHRLRGEMVNTELHNKFLEFIVFAAGYSDSKEIRRLGIDVLKSYLWAFDAPGRFYLLKRIFHTIEHLGLYGYIITQLKNFIIQALSQITPNEPNPFPDQPNPQQMDTWFCGKNLQIILVECVLKLKNGEKTDIMHYFDQIISALNILRFIFIRDGKENKTGIMNYMPTINENFVKPLRTALHITTLHYQGKIKELKDPHSTLPKDTDGEDYNLFVGQIGGERVKHPNEYTKEEHISSYEHALIELDLMEGVLARVTECYEKAVQSPN